MVSTDVVVVLVTVPQDLADTLARGLIERRLAACVQVVAEVSSTYRWLGQVETAKESRLEIKTGAESVAALVTAIRDAHPYEVPEVLVIPVIGGNAEYLRWVRAESVEEG